MTAQHVRPEAHRAGALVRQRWSTPIHIALDDFTEHTRFLCNKFGNRHNVEVVRPSVPAKYYPGTCLNCMMIHLGVTSW